MYNLEYINQSNSEFKDKFGQTLSEELDFKQKPTSEPKSAAYQKFLDDDLQLVNVG